MGEAGRWNPAGVAAGRGFICFAAQFTANDRAAAGRNTIEPLGSHMCGWAKDNRRCSWNSQTGYKIASRMQRKRKEPSVLHNEKPPACSASWGAPAARASFSRSPEDPETRVRVCRAEWGSSSRLRLASVGFCPGSVAFHWVWWAQRQPRSALPPRCALVLGMEKKLGSGPERNRKQPPSSLPLARPVWNGILSGWQQWEAQP